MKLASKTFGTITARKVSQRASTLVYRILETLAMTQCGRTLEHIADTGRFLASWEEKLNSFIG